MEILEAYKDGDRVYIAADPENVVFIPPNVFNAAYAVVFLLLELDIQPHHNRIKLIKSVRAGTDAPLVDAKRAVEVAIEAIRSNPVYAERTKGWGAPALPVEF